jgi:HEAT repeats
MNTGEISQLPKALRTRAGAAFAAGSTPLNTTYNTLLLLQEATLYLAGLAVAEYRAFDGIPNLEAEMAIASFEARATLDAYSKVLLQCVAATGSSSKIRPLLTAEFPTARNLGALIDIAAGYQREIRAKVEERINELQADHVKAPNLVQYLKLLGDFRNRAFAHTDWHGLDGAEDFFPVAAPILREVAEEFLTLPAVTAAWCSLRPASVTEVLSEGRVLVRILDNEDEMEVGYSNTTRAGAVGMPLHKGVVIDTAGASPTIVGWYRQFGQDRQTVHPEVEATVSAILTRDGPVKALDALYRFFDRAKDNGKLRKEWLKPSLVDDVVISALQHFKFNGDTVDESIPRRVYSMLEFTSENLPRRIIRDAGRYAMAAVRHPSRPQGRVQGDRVIQQAGKGTVKGRRQAVVKLGYRSDEDSMKTLARLAETDEWREVRGQALLSIGARKDPTSTELLMEAASKHRSDPEIACCALIGLASIADVSSVKFLVGYLSSDAPYTCTDAAAWALAAVAQENPDSVQAWKDELLRLAQGGNEDPYTRGTLLYCLSKLQDATLVEDIASLVCREEDPFVVEDACAALATFGGQRSVDALIAVLEATEGALSDLCVKREAVRALGVTGGVDAAAALRAFIPPAECRFVERVLNEAVARCEAGLAES